MSSESDTAQGATYLAAQQAAIEAQAATWTDENQGPMLLHAVWTLLGLATIFVALRIYVKTRKTNRLYWDDLFIGLALVVGYGHAICISKAVHYGLGRHMLYLESGARENCLEIGFISLSFGYLSPMLGRISFCITLLYLTATDPRVKRWPTHLVVALQLAVNIVAVIVLYSQCGNQLDILWVTKKQQFFLERCWDPKIQTKYGYFMGAMNTATDLYMTVIPALLITHTRLSLKSKLGLTVLLCLSVLYIAPPFFGDLSLMSDRAMVASVVKTHEAKVLSSPLDYTYDLVMFVVWISVELNVVMIVSSVPVLRPLFQRQSKRVVEQFARYDVSLGSVFSKRGTRSAITELSNTSEEKLATPNEGEQGMDTAVGITVTHEVSVTYQTNDAPFVHAALVGLVQGEIMKRNVHKPRLRHGA